ncbi:MAG: hypothetical protein JSS20_09520, partial [Proteobacteria bacterium]|nr:hypothetical protein [Pseudomonadota bacterium]
MSGFSPEWLALREPVDHRSRDPRLAARLEAEFRHRPALRIVDLGAGTGSNLRGTALHLPAEQEWTLVDYDARLIARARVALEAWADTAEPLGEGLLLHKGGKRLRVGFRAADLNTSLDAALGQMPDLVTASAFFDLCSPEFIGRLASHVVSRRASFFTVLTYNGQQSWAPAHDEDALMHGAFLAHQRIDKGFGPSCGPAAAAALGATFQASGYRVFEGDSPWLLGPGDIRLIKDLADGVA